MFWINIGKLRLISQYIQYWITIVNSDPIMPTVLQYWLSIAQYWLKEISNIGPMLPKSAYNRPMISILIQYWAIFERLWSNIILLKNQCSLLPQLVKGFQYAPILSEIAHLAPKFGRDTAQCWLKIVNIVHN